MTILLINPPRSPENAILSHAPEEARPFIHRKLIGPPLGLITLAAALKDRDVAVLDLKGELDLNPEGPDVPALVREWLTRTRPRVVGVTVIASELPASLEILRTVKNFDPGILTVAGGLHATLCPEDFQDPAVDVLCIGPAVHSFAEVVGAWEKGEPLDRVGGVWLRHNGRLAPGALPPRSCEPAGRDYVFPDRSHLRRWLSTYVVGRAPGPSTYVFTSLGCPYRCAFCSIWPQFKGEYLQREVESVIQELKTVDEYPVVRFADGNTLVNLDFAERLFERIEEEGIRKAFIMDIRADTAANHPRLIEKLARGGLKVVITGFESFRDEELASYHKDMEGDVIAEAVRVFRDNGILMRGNYIVRPDYDVADFDALADYAGRHSVAFAGYTILTPMPGTPFYRAAKDQIVDWDLAKYNFFNCVMKTRLPLEEFYERAGALWRIREGTETI